MNNLPKIDAKYWVLMLLATTIGEIVGNLISRNLGLGYTAGSIFLIGIYALALASIMFFKAAGPMFYWVLIVFGNIAGTNIADFIVISPLNLGAAWGSVLVMGVLSTILFLWKLSAHGFQIEKKMSRTTESLYWLAILMSSTFGTTAGDFITSDTPLGALGGSMFLLGVLFIIALLVTRVGFSKTLAYWLALVLIHPVGATVGNYISKPIGLDLGNIVTSIALLLLFALVYSLNPSMLARRSPV